ncbi:MAG TPA: TatD family hydrolase [Draconibacterium sp.]|nr:TatD family hydrolase [Draconibacterium sp.]
MKIIPYIDIHTHPFSNEKNTITIQNINPGDRFAAFNGRNFYSIGLHPWNLGTKDENNQALQLVEEALEFDHVICVGEAGLDKISGGDYIEQLRVFEAQAIIAEEYQYPLIIHCVKALNEVVELRKKMNPAMPWILHAYNGSVETTKQIIDHGFFFSFGRNLFRDNSKAAESLKLLPLNKVFFETDESETGVELIYKQAAALKEMPLEELKEAVWNNFNQVEKSLIPGKI